MTTLNISLPESLKNFVEEQVAVGGYSTASEYVRSLICEAQERKTKAELEGKLLAALGAEATSMGTADWEQLRECVRRMAAETTSCNATSRSRTSRKGSARS
jgi:antitoxin ParD1/3/4